MTVNWQPLRQELSLWRRGALQLPLWWRDDDAIEVTNPLDKLLFISEKINIPVHIAVIPKQATQGLADHLNSAALAVPIVHGWSHQNHAPEGAKKAEFNHPRAAAVPEAQAALTRMQALFGAGLLPMFVPPWNRISGEVTNTLERLGFTALSTFTPRGAAAVAGLAQINTHVDPIFWKQGGGLRDPDVMIAELVALLRDRREGRTDRAEPLGVLTHHLVHDAAIWEFTERCLSELLEGGAVACNLWEMKDLP